jgi:hypothetical protein
MRYATPRSLAGGGELFSATVAACSFHSPQRGWWGAGADVTAATIRQRTTCQGAVTAVRLLTLVKLVDHPVAIYKIKKALFYCF